MASGRGCPRRYNDYYKNYYDNYCVTITNMLLQLGRGCPRRYNDYYKKMLR